MKRSMRWLGLAVIYLIGIGISLLSSVNVFNGRFRLDTQKTDRHIEQLGKLHWFNELYECERHQSSFLFSLQIRKYLNSSFRVQLLKSSEREQKKFIQKLEKVAEAWAKNHE
ncbi:nitrite reductase [Planococcus sp. YIM B11945]|uniref:nitrite reductase n=1 Tax=Planococcus sp. YIM B11945 TaxID=3435410 RepID=UPI003D7E87CF